MSTASDSSRPDSPGRSPRAWEFVNGEEIKDICGGPVAGDRDVPWHGDSQQRLHVVIMRMRLQRIPEEDEQVDSPVRDAGTDLLVPAEGAAVEPCHGQVELLAEHPPGGSRRVEPVAGEQVTVELGPFAHVLLAAVVRDERDPPLSGVEFAVVGYHPPSMPGRCCRNGTRGLAACVGSRTSRPAHPPRPGRIAQPSARVAAGKAYAGGCPVLLPCGHAFRSAAPYLAAPTDPSLARLPLVSRGAF